MQNAQKISLLLSQRLKVGQRGVDVNQVRAVSHRRRQRAVATGLREPSARVTRSPSCCFGPGSPWALFRRSFTTSDRRKKIQKRVKISAVNPHEFAAGFARLELSCTDGPF
jgi:hypothetical protein